MDHIEEHDDIIDLGIASVETQGGPFDYQLEAFNRRLPQDAISKD